MENIVETVEKFLIYSDEKLTELSEKNQKLRLSLQSLTEGGDKKQ